MSSFILKSVRQPATSAFFKQSFSVKPTSTSIVFRNFTSSTRSTPLKQTVFKQSSSKCNSKPFFQQSYRGYQTGPAFAPQPSNTQRFVKAGLLFGGTMLGLQLFLNRETSGSSLSLYEREYLNSTFAYTGVGLAMIGASAKLLHTNGWTYRLMSSSPWLVMGLGLVGSIGTMMATRMTDPDNTVQKLGCWTAFNVVQGALLAPLYFYSPAILARAGLYTLGMMGSIAYIGATAKNDTYLWLGAPLMGGLAIVALSGLAPLVLPVGSRVLAASESIWLYGGLAVFGGITLYDVQKILARARMARQGLVKRDPVNESISLELDFINIFIRLVTILQQRDSRRR